MSKYNCNGSVYAANKWQFSFDSYFGDGVYKGNAELTVKNGAHADAILCLYNIVLKKTIRNEYVRKNTNFTIRGIPAGHYWIRVLYGNNWNIEKHSPCETLGYFESDISFTEFDRMQQFEDDSTGYTVAEVTLYTVENGNASSSKMKESDFFDIE